MRRARQAKYQQYTPLKDAKDYTLTLKIQMKGVTKPPMWRQVEVPANFSFAKLHQVIQVVAGFDNDHLWMFTEKAYDSMLNIGSSTEYEKCTHNATTTPLTKFLAQRGDKLEYVYDYGDDWIFTVEVQSIDKRQISHPALLKYKCDLNPMDDIGGPYAYLRLRELLAKDYSDEVAEELSFMFGDIEDEDDLDALRESLTLDPTFINERLAKL